MHHAKLLIAAVPVAGSRARRGLASASSHREAPFVTEHPKVDATDFYMFTSYESGREDYVTLVANYLPLQDPYGGPNYFTLDPNATYRIHVDNDGDSIEDITFLFRFENRLSNLSLKVGNPGGEKTIAVPLKNIGPITATDSSNLNEREGFGVWVVNGPLDAPTSITRLKDAGSGDVLFRKPVDNIGAKSIPNYAAYASSFVYDILLPDGNIGRMFGRPAPGPVRGQPGRDLRPPEPRPPGRGRRQVQLAGGQERDLAGARDPEELPARHGPCDRRLDDGGAAADHRAPGGPDVQGSRARDAAHPAGLAPRHAARQRGRDRPQGQEPVQREQAQGRRPIPGLRHQPGPAGAGRGALPRHGAEPLPAHRPDPGVPHGHPRPERQRGHLGDAAAQPGHALGQGARTRRTSA
jgi:hypothetical protein